MHTVVVHLDKRLHDWSLIEPFFYKAQSSNLLTFFDIPLTKASLPNYKKLTDILSQFLYQYGIDNWQLLLLLPNTNEEKRLNHYLFSIQEEVIQSLKQKKIHPRKTAFIMMESLETENGTSVIEKNFNMLDTLGYIEDVDFIPLHNLFTSSEIKSLDKAWGAAVDMSQVGILDKPNEGFVRNLEKKFTNVIKRMDELLEPKINLAKQYQKRDFETIFNIIPIHMLQTIRNIFLEKFKSYLTPVLSKHLAHMKPSHILKQVLVQTISLQALLKEVRLIRIPLHHYSSSARLMNIIQTALFIHILTHDPKILKEIPKGNSYELTIDINVRQLQTIIEHNIRALEIASDQIDSSILDTLVHKVDKFEEIKVDTIQIKWNDSVQMSDVNWDFSNITKFQQEWDYYMNHMESEFNKREKMLFSSVQEAAAKLAISKREGIGEKDYANEKVHLESYLHELESKMEMIQQHTSNQSLNHQQVQSDWRQFARRKTRELQNHLKCFPSTQMIILMYSLIWFSLFFPYFTILSIEPKPFTISFWFVYVLIPICIASITILIGLIVRKKLWKPITNILTEVDHQARHFIFKMKDMPKEYEHYFKQIYRLFKLRKQYYSLQVEATKKQQKNVLFRYHQGQIQHYKTNLEIVKKRLKYSGGTSQHEVCQQFVEQTFQPERSVIHNPIYSPLDYLFQQTETNIETEIRSAKIEANLDIYPLVTNIKLQMDKVYNQ